jgi:hypothetical protein
MRIDYRFIILLILIATLPIISFSLGLLRLAFRLPPQSPEEKPKTPRPLKPKSEDDCPQCRAKKDSPPGIHEVRPTPRPWCGVKSNRGRKKTICTRGYACNNRKCSYYHIMDASIHALVGYESHGKNESIQDLRCQVSGK